MVMYFLIVWEVLDVGGFVLEFCYLVKVSVKIGVLCKFLLLVFGVCN